MVTRAVIEACMAHRHVKLQRKKRWNGVLCTKKHFIPQTKDPSLPLFETQEPQRICDLQTGLNTKFGNFVKRTDSENQNRLPTCKPGSQTSLTYFKCYMSKLCVSE